MRLLARVLLVLTAMLAPALALGQTGFYNDRALGVTPMVG